MTDALRTISVEVLKSLSKSDLVTLMEGEQELRANFQAEIDRLKSIHKELEDQVLQVNGKYIRLKNKLFGRSSEKSLNNQRPVNETKPKKKRNSKKRKSSKRLTEKYPNLPIVDQTVSFDEKVECACCQSQMKNSGLSEVVEYLDVTPKKYSIIRQRREKYRCSTCYSAMSTVPSPPRIKPGSSYSDAFILDVALSKYCDLIPIERYAAMGKRQGLNLPSNSLIGLTHHLATFLQCVYELLKRELLIHRVLYADETKHRMLEGDENPNWYLWGFSNQYTCYFEYQNTRSGSVATNILLNSTAQVLVSDVFSGYIKAVKDVNKIRNDKNICELIAAFCNSHSRRKFKDAEVNFQEETSYYINQYKKIYKIEKKCKNISPRRVKKFRKKMIPIFRGW